MKKQPRVLITGVGGPAGKAAARYFNENNFYVIGVDLNGDITTPVHEFHKAYPANDQRYLSQLLTLAVTKNIPLVVPTVSEELPMLSLNRHKFIHQKIQIYISPAYPVYICNDKYYTSAILELKDIAVPKFVIPQKNSKILYSTISVMDFPILAKPRVSRGGRGIVIYNNLEEIKKESREEILFQEFASGDEYDVNICIDSQKPHRILASQVLQKTSLKNGNVGNAETVKRVDQPEVKRLAERAAKALELTGPLDIDIRKTVDGQPVLLEINARLGANCLTAPEVLDAMIWMWRRDCGNTNKNFVFSQNPEMNCETESLWESSMVDNKEAIVL